MEKKKESTRVERHPLRRHYQNLLLHVPHSSIVFPGESDFTFNDLDEDERLLIDYYTDELFIPECADEKIVTAVFPYCRLYCDVERLINDPLQPSIPLTR